MPLPAELSLGDELRIGGPIPSFVTDQWQLRRQAYRAVHWKLQVRELLPKGFLNPTPEHRDVFGPLPLEPTWREREFQTWIDLVNRRVRHERSGVIPNLDKTNSKLIMGRDRVVYLLNGNNLQSNQLEVPGWDAPPPNALTQEAANSNALGIALEAAIEPAFWGLGIAFGPENSYQIDRLQEPFQSRSFRLFAIEGASGSRKLTLRAPSQLNTPQHHLEYTVAEELQSGIVRKSLFMSNTLARQITADWTTDDAIAHPSYWRGDWYSPSGTLILPTEVRCTTWDVNPDLTDVEFHVAPEAGEHYYDAARNDFFVASGTSAPDTPRAVYEIRNQSDGYRWIGATLVLLAVGSWILGRLRTSRG